MAESLRAKAAAPWRIKLGWLVEVARALGALHAAGKTRGDFDLNDVTIDDEGAAALEGEAEDGGDPIDDQKSWGKVAREAFGEGARDVPPKVIEAIATAERGEHASIEAAIAAVGAGIEPPKRKAPVSLDAPPVARGPSLILPLVAVLVLGGLVAFWVKRSRETTNAALSASAPITTAPLPPDEPIEVTLKRGADLLEHADNAGALEAFDRAAKADATNDAVWLGKARALEGLGEDDRALRELERCVAVAPKSAACWESLATNDARLGRCSAALEAVRRLAALDASAAKSLKLLRCRR